MTAETRNLHSKASARLSWSRHSIASMAAGEGLARLCNLALLILISRRFGVRTMGAYALAQALSLYLSQGIDLGLRHIGAGLIASRADNVQLVVSAVQRKRLILAIPVITVGYYYGRIGPVPSDTRSLVSMYALSMIGYAFSLDWLAWGMKRFGWMSGWRALVSFLGLAITAPAVQFLHVGPTVIALGNGVAYAIAAYILWQFWAKRVLLKKTTLNFWTSHPDVIIQWKSVFWMGLAMLANQAFSSIDVMILGYLADSTQTGLYSAAYRMFLLVLAIYYLVMQALYPQLAAISAEQRNFRTLQPYIKRIGLAGIGITILMELIRKPLIGILYGAAFVDADRLAIPILLAIPLELIASFLLTAIIAWGESRTALAATVTAGLCNVALNFCLIPRYGAMGASYATPLSYGVFLLVLLLCLWKPLRPSKASDMKFSTAFN